jgi:Rieske Fe-S protein
MSDPKLTRRQALTIVAVTACSCAMTEAQDGDRPRRRGPGGGGGEGGGGGGDGSGEAAKEKTPPAKALVIGKLADFEKPGFYDTFTKTNKIYVRRLDDRLVVMSASCTHKGCVIKQDAPDVVTLRCPCHKSSFDAFGTPTEGPAKTALPRYALTQSADGTITADLTRSFTEKEWDEPGAMIAVEKKA